MTHRTLWRVDSLKMSHCESVSEHMLLLKAQGQDFWNLPPLLKEHHTCNINRLWHNNYKPAFIQRIVLGKQKYSKSDQGVNTWQVSMTQWTTAGRCYKYTIWSQKESFWFVSHFVSSNIYCTFQLFIYIVVDVYYFVHLFIYPFICPSFWVF